MSKLFNVSCCCVPETDVILLEFLLSVQEKQTGDQWQLANDMSGDIAIIDLDDKAGMDLYEKLKTDKSSPIIITFSSETSKVDAEFHLNKPMRSADFVTLIKNLISKHPNIGSANIAKKFNGHKKDNSQTTIKNTINIQLKRPSVKRLYNLLTDSNLSYSNGIEISYREVSIYVDFSSKRFYCEHKLMLLSMLCKANIDSLQIKEITDYDLSKVENEIVARPLPELIWCCALLGSSGELTEKVNQETLLHLKRWPNLKSLLHLPRHITLTAFMTKHTATLGEIFTQTKILPENIIDFINACLIMGYLNIDESKEASNPISIKTDSKKQGLFGKLRNKFGVKSAS